jgi:hypothetical protein
VYNCRFALIMEVFNDIVSNQSSPWLLMHNYDTTCHVCLKISAAELFWDSIISIPSSHWCCPHQTTSFLTWPPPTIFCDLLPSCAPPHDLFFLVSLSCFLSHLLQLKFWCYSINLSVHIWCYIARQGMICSEEKNTIVEVGFCCNLLMTKEEINVGMIGLLSLHMLTLCRYLVGSTFVSNPLLSSLVLVFIAVSFPVYFLFVCPPQLYML